MSHAIDPAVRALIRALERANGAPLIVESIAARPWASATFTGARHRLGLRIEGDAASARADRLAREIGAMEFVLPRVIVADIVVAERGEAGALLIEALLLDSA